MITCTLIAYLFMDTQIAQYLIQPGADVNAAYTPYDYSDGDLI